jgi:hypothetical protein
MPAVGQDIVHYKGDSATITISVQDGAGNFVNLSGATARWWMGKSVSATGADVYIKKAIGSGLEIDQPTTSEWDLVITLDPGDTENLTKVGTFYHEAEVVDADGNVSTVTIGKFTLKPTLIPDIL